MVKSLPREAFVLAIALVQHSNSPRHGIGRTLIRRRR
jgi:hypothetical protein